MRNLVVVIVACALVFAVDAGMRAERYRSKLEVALTDYELSNDTSKRALKAAEQFRGEAKEAQDIARKALDELRVCRGTK